MANPHEQKPIPQLAKSAAALVQQDFQRVLNEIGTQTLAAMGIDAADGWTVDFTAGVAVRDVPQPDREP